MFLFFNIQFYQRLSLTHACYAFETRAPRWPSTRMWILTATNRCVESTAFGRPSTEEREKAIHAPSHR